MNWTRWEFTQDNNNPPWSMDRRHVEMVACTLVGLHVKRAVEIGCLNGRSTTAFVEARQDGGLLQWVGLCDKTPLEPVHKVIGAMTDAGIRVETLWNESRLIPWVAECWLIDGDHDAAAVWADFHLALKGGAKAIILHDTCHKQFHGPAEVAKHLRMDAGFQVFEDFEKRPGEETERGLMIAAQHISPILRMQLNALAKK